MLNSSKLQWEEVRKINGQIEISNKCQDLNQANNTSSTDEDAIASNNEAGETYMDGEVKCSKTVYRGQ